MKEKDLLCPNEIDLNAKDVVIEDLSDLQESENKIDQIKKSYEVLAVIDSIDNAHVFIDNLKTKAKEMSIFFKLETNTVDLLTKEEIEKAKCIIIATDKQIEMSRFNGKPVIITKVNDDINQAEKLLKQAVSGQVAVFDEQINIKKSLNKKQIILKTLFTQLNEGMHKILPILMGSGTLISIATLVVSYNFFNISSLVDNVWIANSYVFGNAIQGMIIILLAGFIGQAIAMQAGFAAGFS